MSVDPEIRTIRTSEELEEILALSADRPVLFLKHSTRCPVSSFAHDEYRAYAGHATSRGVECAVILVVENRPVSMELAERLGVKHQSPQAILVKDRRAVWHDSHEGIRVGALEAAEQKSAG